MLKEALTRLRVVLKVVSKQKLEVTEILQLDHMRLEILMAQLKVARGQNLRERLFRQIMEKWNSHDLLEQSIFYPACDKIESLKSSVLEFTADHRHIKTLIKELAHADLVSELNVAKMDRLIKDLTRHVRTEESEFFPKVRHLMSKNRLERLGTQLQSRKQPSKAA